MIFVGSEFLDRPVHTHRDMAARNSRTYTKVDVHKLLRCTINSNVKTTYRESIDMLFRGLLHFRETRGRINLFIHTCQNRLLKLELITRSQL